MSISQQPYAIAGETSNRKARFIPRQLAFGNSADGAVAPGAGIAGLIGGVGGPLLCLGCLASLALVGLFATMIGAAAYMNAIQSQYRKNLQGAGTTIELNFVVLFCALVCSFYMLTKHRRGVAISS